MWHNFLKISLRNFLGNKLYSFINIFGLAMGLSSVMLIGLFVADELSYDQFHPDADRIYRISRDFYPSEGVEEMALATLAAPIAPLLDADFPEIESIARMYGGRVLLGNEEVAFYENAVMFVDPALFDIFHFEWIDGDPASALQRPDAIVLTATAARKYFGDSDPLGQQLKLENSLPVVVGGVIADLPSNTHLRGDAFVSIEAFLNVIGERARNDFGTNAYHTYARLKPGTNVDTLVGQFPAFMNRHVRENESRYSGLDAMPVTDIHLHSTRQLEMSAPGSMANVLTLITVACGILVIACFNFMNLATARSALRGKEVGVRKSIGAERKHLIVQFLGESIVMTALATLVAIVIVELVLPAFNGFTGKHLNFDLLGDGTIALALVVMMLGVGSLSGSYPAFYLSSFEPAKVLKRRVAAGLGDVLFRNLLVVLQFSISIVLVIATVVVLLQTRYAQELDMGFDREQVVVLAGPPSQGVTDRWELLKEELLRNPDIVAATASNMVPGTENLNSYGVRTPANPNGRDMAFMMVDYDFFETFAVDLLSGRTFSKEFPNDRVGLPTPDNMRSSGSGFILNESAARELGWTPEQAVDEEFEVFTYSGLSLAGRIVGVVADSNFESARFNTKPMVFILTPPGLWLSTAPTLGSASLRISGRNLEDTLAYIDSTWQTVIPEFPVTRSFLSERFAALYQQDTRLGTMFSSFAVLAILVACLGLFGLATFNTQRRIKEIGVRKVMGGSVASIVMLLTKDFSRLVLLSNVIAWPAAWYLMNSWLQNFAYRIDLTLLIFIGSGLIALCVAWVTVGGTAAKAASAKPVLALRYE